MKTIVIGIAGAKRSGKNTAAALLQQCLAEWDQEVLVGQTAFADPMYAMLAAFVGEGTVSRLRDSDDKDTEIIEPFGCTLRRLMQTLGTEWGRNLIHTDAWVMATSTAILQAEGKEGRKNPIVVFIPDVRFDNEAQFVRDNGFLLHIQRDSKQSDTHSSETPLFVEDTDTVIQNNGTLEQFEQKVLSYGRKTLFTDLTEAIQTSNGVGRLLSDTPEGS
jgi:hypothetical protein